ncbi:MAG: dinitrogenase iron-molybdenum cofactor biosynthesis protein [Aquificae bacterium]|jgi:predicted Fe-Mo cluster-binding NifX family protein|nr:dinitrogenase iron-molybdenum cofactor biosynthesis protein [Aquificota bacterium]
MKVAVPINRPRDEKDLRVSAHFGKAYAFAIVDLDTGEIKVVENPRIAMGLEHGAGRLIAEMFTKEGVEAVLLREIGHGAFGHLTQRGIKIYLVPKEVKTVEEAINLFKEGKLNLLLEPNEPPHQH